MDSTRIIYNFCVPLQQTYILYSTILISVPPKDVTASRTERVLCLLAISCIFYKVCSTQAEVPTYTIANNLILSRSSKAYYNFSGSAATSIGASTVITFTLGLPANYPDSSSKNTTYTNYCIVTQLNQIDHYCSFSCLLVLDIGKANNSLSEKYISTIP